MKTGVAPPPFSSNEPHQFLENHALFSSSLLQVLSDYFLLLTECLNSHCHTHNLSLSLSVCCHGITLSSPLPWVGFTFSKRIILCCCVGAHQQEGGERKTKAILGRMMKQVRDRARGEEEREMNVPGLNQTDTREENGREMAEARN